jgi:hypothetical protein
MSVNSYSGKFRLFRKDDWTKLPAMRWQIQDLVPLHGVTLLFGPAKIGKKSFISISMAGAVAAEKDWCGYTARKGKVLYVVPEDFYGILRRQEAWEITHGCKAGENLRYLRVPVNFSDKDDVKAALDALEAQGFVPDFIVIDTLARSMSGAEENVAKDMSRVFELLEAFRAALNDATILVVHHTTKDGLNYRGSSVIKGAVDALIESKAIDKGPVIALTSAGFKNVADFETFQVRCEAVMVDTDEGQQQVLAIKESIAGAAANTQPLSNGAAKLLSLLAKLPNGAAFAEWRKASGLHPATFKRHRKELLNEKLVAIARGKYHLAPQPQPTPDENKNEAHSKDQLGLRLTPFRSVSPVSPVEPGIAEPYLSPREPLSPNTGCRNGDATANGKTPNEINEGEELDLVAEVLRHVADRKSRT